MLNLYSIVALVLFSLAASAGELPERIINVRDTYPSISPDGTVLVFQSNRAGVNQIFAKTIGGESSETNQLTQAEFGAETPVISPDGRKIAFAMYVAEGNNDVFVMNIDGSGMRQLTDGPGYDGHPHWNADGSRIAFNSDRTTPDPAAAWSDRWHEIFSMKSDGSDVRQHTRCKSVCTYGSLSPDGQTVLYRKLISGAGLDWALNDVDDNSEIFIANIDGGDERNLSNHPAFDGWPVWSATGKRIAFASNRDGPALVGQVWTMKPDGSGLQQETRGDWSYVQPAWSFAEDSIYAYQHKETEDYEFGSIVRIGVTPYGPESQIR